MRLVRVWLFIWCNIGQVVAGNSFGGNCYRDSSLETSTNKGDASNYDDKVIIKKIHEENCLSNISLPRRYDNCFKLEEENAFYTSHSYSFKNKEYDTTEFDISKVKLELKDATKS